MDKIDQAELPLLFVRRSDARRYILRVTRDRTVRVTVPRYGTIKEAQAFVDKHRSWVEKQLHQQRVGWTHGAMFMYRGEKVELLISEADGKCVACFGPERLLLPRPLADYKPLIEGYLKNIACAELPARTLELARLHSLEVRRVTIRDQRSRWGSCSVRKAISLNWRLVQTPLLVRDYIIIHELMHLREMNHSRQFWKHVATAFPDYLKAERWLRRNSSALRA